MTHDPRSVLPIDDLPQTPHAHEFVGADHGAIPFSLILVHAPTGEGPGVHQHPYAEVFIVEQGQATFRLGDSTIEVHAGEIVVGPPGVPHGFTSSGPNELRLTAVHGADRFETEWLAGPDEDWAS